MRRMLMMFMLLISVIDPVMADEDMTSGLICSCECEMIISTCDCFTAIQVKKEITQMKEKGFPGNQILSALQVEYGKEIIAPLEEDISSKIKKYDQQFEEEYRNFLSETDEPNQKKNPVSNDTSTPEDKL